MEDVNGYRGAKGTKFQLTLLTLSLGTLMLVLDKVSGEQWTFGVVGMVAAYITGDVAGRFAGVKK